MRHYKSTFLLLSLLLVSGVASAQSISSSLATKGLRTLPPTAIVKPAGTIHVPKYSGKVKNISHSLPTGLGGQFDIKYYQGEGNTVWISNVSGALSPSTASPANVTPSPSTLALQYLSQASLQLGLPSPGVNFTFESETKDVDLANTWHVKTNQVYKGLPVWGAQMIVHLTNGEATLANGKFYTIPAGLNTSPVLSQSNSNEVALLEVTKSAKSEVLSEETAQLLDYSGPISELVLYPGKDRSEAVQLAYHVTVRPNGLLRFEVFVDANTGKVLHSYNNTCADGPVSGSGLDLKNNSRNLNLYQGGSTYYLLDLSRPMYKPAQSSLPNNAVGAIWTIDAVNTAVKQTNHITSSSTNISSKVGVSAHYHAGLSYEYFLNTHSRNSLNGSGGTMISIVNVSEDNGSGLDNAYWNGKFIAYGNGNSAFTPLAAALDVAGHEMSHGVIETSANLEYQGQSGALNESLADVFGVMIDRDDWTLGEDIVRKSVFPSGALRSLQDPHNGGSSLGDGGYQPRTMSEFYSGTQDNGGVHINSGITNWAFYKFATAMDKNKGEIIWYRALTTYLTKTSQFLDMRVACEQSAKDIFGAASPEFTEVGKAFDAVGIFGSSPPDEQEDLPTNAGNETILYYSSDNADQYYLYEQNINGTGKVNVSRTEPFSRPSITDDGSYMVFIGIDKRMYGTDLTTRQTTAIQSDPQWNNVAISKDGRRIAAISNAQEPIMYIYSFETQQWYEFDLFNPTYTEGVEVGDVVTADQLEWDYTGNTVLYDAQSKIPVNGGDYVYWDVAFIDVWDARAGVKGSGKIEKLFTNLPEGVVIGNPAYSKNSAQIIAFDYIEESTGNATLATVNTNNYNTGIVFRNTIFNFPTYNRLDNAILFNAKDNNDVPVVAVINMQADKLTPTGSAQVGILEAKWGQWVTRGTRKLLSSEKDILSFGFPQFGTQAAQGTISGNTITVKVPMNADLTNISATFTSSNSSIVTNNTQTLVSGATALNYSSGLQLTVRAEDNSTRIYNVVIERTQEVGITVQSASVSLPVNVYPIPAKNVVNVVLPSNSTRIDYTIVTTSGSIVTSGYLGGSNSTISMDGLQDGLYLLQLRDKEGRKAVIKLPVLR